MLFSGGEIFSQSNCSAPTTGFTSINDLGTGISPETGLMGGLYPNGSNFLPSAHKNAGLQMASQVQCLDTNGNPDVVNGKIVWLSIGMSNTTQESQQFIQQANGVGKRVAERVVKQKTGLFYLYQQLRLTMVTVLSMVMVMVISLRVILQF